MILFWFINWKNCLVDKNLFVNQLQMYFAADFFWFLNC
jgi:hypothetical protein